MSRLLLAMFWLTLVAVYALALLPPGNAPTLGNDKIAHMAAFFTLAVLASLAWPKLPALRIGLGLAAFGVFIELSQMLPALHRDASFLDWLADGAAIGVGLAAAWPFRRVIAASR